VYRDDAGKRVSGLDVALQPKGLLLAKVLDAVHASGCVSRRGRVRVPQDKFTYAGPSEVAGGVRADPAATYNTDACPVQGLKVDQVSGRREKLLLKLLPREHKQPPDRLRI
jgi:hypothetical protein